MRGFTTAGVGRFALLLATATGCWALLPAGPAHAACPQSWLFASVDTDRASYVVTPGVDPATHASRTSMTADAKSFYWALGYGDPAQGLGHDSGQDASLRRIGTPGRSWLLFDHGYPVYLFGNWSGIPVDGCISQTPLPFQEQCMALVVADQVDGAGYFAVLTKQRSSDGPIDFQFGEPDSADIVLAPIAPPRIRRLERLATGQIVVALDPPDPAAGLSLEPACPPAVVGWRTRQRRLPPGAGPPPNRAIEAGWELAAQATTVSDRVGPLVALGDGTRVVLDCTTGEDHFLATTYVLDSGYETPFVSANSVRIPCRRCTDGLDFDGDGFCAVAAGDLPRDCDDADPTVFPWAPQRCDGRNNDCRDPFWPAVPDDEIDVDLDGFAACDGDCDDDDASVWPGAIETCNGLDDDCNGVADDDAHGVDSDGDDVANACDNCPFAPNAGQQDADADGLGDACDGCTDRDGDGSGNPGHASCRGGAVADCDDAERVTYPGARELFDGRDNDCDGAIDEGLDGDGDGIPDHRDACPETPPGSGVDASGCGVCS